jgi:ATP-dependent helicase HrpB
LTPLPIDTLLPEIAARLAREDSLIIEAPPGAGKTTRVPPALLALGGEVLVLEPRRLAARLAARRVAAERGENVGDTVGYQVRFEEIAGPRTRLRFLTEGVLTRRFLSDPALARAAVVVLDEFHERHLEGDLALALLRRLQRTVRPELRIVIMSATLETAPVAEYFGGCTVLRSEGRQYELSIEYTPHSAAPLEEQVAGALERLGRPEGHTLVFFPGAAEIRRAAIAAAPFARRHGCLLLPLHGDQPPEEQDRAVAPSAQPKIILSTNVAESSVTIDGVTAVIDSGLARVAAFSPWSGLPELRVARISQASANQRAGRAGRTGPGRVIRLYPFEDFTRRPPQDAPEIARAELAPAALLLRAMGVADFAELPWLDAPPAAAIEHAAELLRGLGATDAAGRLTETGRMMARYPLHPRLARLVVEASRRGAGDDGCAAAAVLSAGERLAATPAHATRSDLLVLLESEWQPYTGRILRQIRAAVGPTRQRGRNEEALLVSVLAAFPDRVARRRQGDDLQLASGAPAQLSASSTVRDANLMVAVEAEDRRDQRAPLVRLASAIEPEWLLDLFPERVTERREVQWNRTGERVEGVSALYYDAIPIEESRGEPDPEAAAGMLAAKAVEAGVARFTDAEELDRYLARVAFAAEHGNFPALGPTHVEDALRALAQGLRSFADLRAAAHHGGLLRALEAQLPAHAARLVDELAPSHIRLPGRRNAPVHYRADQTPWVASRLQDFFGMRETPRVAGGKVPVVVHLLAPNQRPVQTTTDLEGFWKRLYPQLRRELGRRYPRHAWPEDPLAASRG